MKDDYSWVDQPDILDVLKNPSKLHPEVKKYIEENNLLTEKYFSDVKNLQKKLLQMYNLKKMIVLCLEAKQAGYLTLY